MAVEKEERKRREFMPCDFCQVRLVKIQNRSKHYFSKDWEFKIKGGAQAICTEDLAVFWLICLKWIASKSFFLTCTIKNYLSIILTMYCQVSTLCFMNKTWDFFQQYLHQKIM